MSAPSVAVLRSMLDLQVEMNKKIDPQWHAKGFAFLSLEDETGIANVIVTPDLFIENRLMLTSEQFLLVEGRLQNVENVVSVKAESIFPLQLTSAISPSHDFH